MEYARDDRWMVSYIGLSIITFGIYGYYYFYKMSKDVNLMCNGDGKKTRGLVFAVFMSLITFGIYPCIWYYGAAKRLYLNAPRYGVKIHDDKAIIVLWMTLGIFLLGLGPIVGFYIFIKDCNKVAVGYNMAVANVENTVAQQA